VLRTVLEKDLSRGLLKDVVSGPQTFKRNKLISGQDIERVLSSIDYVASLNGNARAVVIDVYVEAFKDAHGKTPSSDFC
jgi:hypothetical protein